MPKNYADLLNLEKRFEHYLELSRLKKEEMSPIQLQEARRAFFAGLASMMTLLTVDLDGLTENESINCLSFLMIEIDKFWQAETKKG